MDETPERGYPYPQCDPPFVKDAADLPANLKALALAVDTDVTALSSEATRALNPRCATTTGSTGAIATGAALQMNVIDFDNTGGTLPSVADDRWNITDAGLWMFTAHCQGAVGAGTVGAHTLQIMVNGVVRDSNTIASLAAGTAVFNVLVTFLACQVGDRVTFNQIFPGGSTITYSQSRFSAYQAVQL